MPRSETQRMEIGVPFTDEEKEAIREKAGLVPIRRMLRHVVLAWLDEQLEKEES